MKNELLESSKSAITHFPTILSIVGGSLVLISSLVAILFYVPLALDLSPIFGIDLINSVIIRSVSSLVAGSLIIIISFIMHSTNKYHFPCGTLIFALAAASMVGTGGFLVGGIIAMASGLLVIFYKNKSYEIR